MTIRIFIKKLLNSLFKPTAKERDAARKEFILNVLLVGNIFLSLVLFSIASVNKFQKLQQQQQYDGIPPEIMLGVFLIFFIDYILIRFGKGLLASYIFIALYCFVPTYTAFTWGPDTPQVLLGYALIIVTTGILINSKVAFALTCIIFLLLIGLIQSQLQGIIQFQTYWRTSLPDLVDAITYGATLSIIAIISWLSNREIEKSLKRAHASEAALRRQRDSLEKEVEKRTEELRQTQMEKLVQMYRFAEFGRISSGLFHDLVNPLNLVSLNLHRLQSKGSHVDKQKFSETKTLLNRAINGTTQLENFIQTARKQVQNQEIKEMFSLNEIINQSIQMLDHKRKEQQVKVIFDSDAEIKTFGNSIKFTQLMINLIANAIDAYEHRAKEAKKEIKISLHRKDRIAQVIIFDKGVGIKKEHLDRIFEPFFTTKGFKKGTGIGLSICRDVVQKDFKGTIHVESKRGVFTKFIIELPIKKPHKSTI